MKRAILLAILLPFWSSGASVSLGQDNAQQIVSKRVNEYNAWTKAVSTPGATIQAKEVSRVEGAVQFHFFVTGLPTNTIYSEVSWPINASAPAEVFKGISIGKHGDGNTGTDGTFPDTLSGRWRV